MAIADTSLNHFLKLSQSRIQTTGIGSLPHHNVDAAITHAFETRIAYLPQMPARYSSEFMINQALDGLPGLIASEEGYSAVDVERWTARSRQFGEQLKEAVKVLGSEPSANSSYLFEPGPSNTRAWTPFLWELEERKTKIAKVQIAGPLTAQWSVKLSNGLPLSKSPELASQIFELIFVRALSMVQALKSRGILPLLFLDEPSLYALNVQDPQHMLLLKELGMTIQVLKKAGAVVGLHCCSDTHWDLVMPLGFDFLSLDTHLSLPHLLAKPAALNEYVVKGGRFAFGVIPTARVGQFIPALHTETLFETFRNALTTHVPTHAKTLLTQSIYTPACGLALHPPDSADHILSHLEAFAQRVEKEV